MAWLAVDYNGLEGVYDSKPVRYNDCFWIQEWGDAVSLPKGTIKKLIGRTLTWKDEPIEIKENEFS